MDRINLFGRFAAVIFVIITLALTGCSSHIEPTLYPNDHLLKVGPEQADRDIQECNDLADRYVKNASEFDRLARDSLTAGAIGAGTGALGGVIIGENVGRSVAAGAAVGAIIPLLQHIFESQQPSPTRARFVEYCLSTKGYSIIP